MTDSFLSRLCLLHSPQGSKCAGNCRYLLGLCNLFLFFLYESHPDFLIVWGRSFLNQQYPLTFLFMTCAVMLLPGCGNTGIWWYLASLQWRLSFSPFTSLIFLAVSGVISSARCRPFFWLKKGFLRGDIDVN